MRRNLWAAAMACLSLTQLACELQAAAPPRTTSKGGTPRASAGQSPLPVRATPPVPQEHGEVRPPGGQLVLPGRSELSAAAAASLRRPVAGQVRLPAHLLAGRGGSLIGDHGGSVISNNGGAMGGPALAPMLLQTATPERGLPGAGSMRRLLATTPVAGATVVVVDAAGNWVPDPGGNPYMVTTDAAGSFFLAEAPAGANLLLQVLGLPASVGTPTAFLPAVAATTGQAARSVDVDAVSTLTMGYIAAKFVKGAQAVLDKLPGDVEADTRRTLSAAIGDGAVDSLATEAVVTRVEGLRTRNAALDAQIRHVESLLVAGLSDMGEGQPATEVPLTSPQRLAVTPDGQLFIVEGWAERIRRVDLEGRIRAFAGGHPSSNSLATTGEVDIGDERAAREASFSSPRTIALDAAGTVFVADWGNHRIRRIDAGTGVITTVAGSRPIQGISRAFSTPVVGAPPRQGKKGAEAVITAPHAIAVDGEGRCVFAASEGTFRIERDGTLTPLLHDGKVRTPTKLASDSDGRVYAQYAGEGFARLIGDGFVRAADIPPRTFLQTDWHLAAAPGGVLYMHGDGGLHRFKEGAWQQLLSLPAPKKPFGLAASADHVWVSFDVEGDVWRFTPATGAFTRVAGKPTDPREGVRGDELGISRPMALAFDASNRLLVSDCLRGLIWRRDEDGLYRRVAGSGAPPDAFKPAASGPALEVPVGLTTAVVPLQDGGMAFSSGDVVNWVAFQVDAEGQMAPMQLPSPLSALHIAKDAAGAWLVSDTKLGAVPEGRLVRVLAGRVEELVERRQRSVPYGLLPRPDGSLYWTDILAGTVQRRSPEGAITVVAGRPSAEGGFSGDGGPATEARLNWPMALAMDAAGHLYIADSENHRVRRVDARTGVITTLAGAGGPFFSGGTVDAGLRGPSALAFDAAGTLFIADSGHNQIKRIPAEKLPR